MNELTMGQRIAARRKLKNLSQETLAEHLGISRQAVSKWESDAAIPEIDKLIALSKLYEVSVGWLLGVEEQESPAADELTDTQLKMVEEIVRRYKPEPSGKRLLYNLVIVLSGLLAITFIFIWAFPQNSSAVQDYSSQISNLEANYSSIQSQIAALSDGNADIQAQINQMDALLNAQSETSKLLRSYVPVCQLNDDLETVDITFYFFPKVYQENIDAHLNILNSSTGFSQMLECRWTGDRYLVHTTLPLADHYRYSFLLVSDSGYEEELLEENTYFTDLLIHSSFYIAEANPKYTQMKVGESTSIRQDETNYHYDAPVYIPCILETTGFVPFRDVKITLLHNEVIIWEEDFTEAFLALYKKENITVALNPDISVELPQLNEGDRLILELTATTHTDRTLVTRLDDLTVTAP